MKTGTNATRKKYTGATLLLLCAVLLAFAAGCAAAEKVPAYDRQAEAIALSRNEYAAQSNSERTRTLEAMDEMTWYTDGGKLKLSEVGKRMGSVEVGDPSAPGSAFEAFCVVTGLNAGTYLPSAENDPALEEALRMSVNDLTARMYSSGIGGARVMINAMYEEGYLVGDAYSAANFAPMVMLQARAIVKEVSERERKDNHTLSGEIDYEAEGGYFEVLCKALGVADKRLYGKLEERARQALAQNEAALAEQDALAAQLPGVYTTVNGGELQINPDGSYALMYGMSFSVGSWEFVDGVLMIGGEPARLEEDGLYVTDIDVPFTKTADAEGAITDEENEIYSLLDRYHYYQYTQTDVSGWYGDTTDEERVAMAQELLDLFDAMGDGRPDLAAGDFASLINDSYDSGDRSLTVWQTACEVAGVDPAPYDDAFSKANS